MVSSLFTRERTSETNFTYLRVFILKENFQFSLYISSGPKIHAVSPEASELTLGGPATIFVFCFSQRPPEFISLML